jgi:hypothetical protein
MISCSLDTRAEFSFVFREAKRCTPMMSADRSKLSRRAVLFLFVLIGVPSVARSSTLEDSAKELARKIVAALPAGENVSCEIRNISSLKPAEAARIEQALKAELEERGIRLTSGEAAITVVVMLSENFKDLVWTGEIRQGEASQVVLIDLERSPENRASSNAMTMTIRSEKFWEGPEHILDAEQVKGIGGQPWLVLLLPDRLEILEPTGRLEINFPPAASRDPVGKLGYSQDGKTIVFSLLSRTCSADLDTRSLIACLPADGASSVPASSIPFLIDLAPGGSAPPGKGIELAFGSVCGGANQFLATGGRDFTETDSLQVFQMESGGPVAVSTELDFAGPILDLHSDSVAPRAVVRNLKTGNYEANQLSFSCGQ